MKGMGKGQGQQQGPGWGSPNPCKGKGKGPKGSWNPGKGAWGKGGKGAYGLEDDWSEGYCGYNFSYEDTALLSLAREAASEWQFPWKPPLLLLVLSICYLFPGPLPVQANTSSLL